MKKIDPDPRCYDLNGVLRIICNLRDYVPRHFASKVNSSNPDLIVTFSKRDASEHSKLGTRIGTNLYCSENEEQVVSTINILGLKATLVLKRLLGIPTEVFINHTYRLLSKTLLKLPISTAFPAHAFVQMIIHIKLLLKKHTFMLGAGFEPSGSGSAIIISAMGGMGKTQTVLRALREFNGEYLSDDMLIVNKDGTVYPYPKPIRIRRVPLPISLETYKNPTEVLGSKIKIKDESSLGAVCLLERGARNEIIPLSCTEALRKILVVTRKLLPYYMERTLLAYSYVNQSYDPYSLMQVETEILSRFLANGKCYTLTSKSGTPKSYVNLMKGLVNDQSRC